MLFEKNTTTYVIGRCDGLAPQLRALVKWLSKDACERSAQARVIILGGAVFGCHTKAVMDEVYGILQAFPGSTLINGRREQGLLDFLENNLTRSPTMWWMAHGGRAVVESFGVDPTVRRSRDIRRTLNRVSPQLLEVLRAGKEYEIEGDYCVTQDSTFPSLNYDDQTAFNQTDCREDNIALWRKAVDKIVIHEHAPTNDCYPDFNDWEIDLGVPELIRTRMAERRELRRQRQNRLGL